jgi:hypothetical protein
MQRPLVFCEFKKKGGVILLYYFKMFICWNNLVSTSYVLYFLLLDSSYCSNYCSSNISKINLMGVILYIWQKRGIFCINFLVKNLESNNQYLFPQTMISRFNLLPHRHFIYRFLILIYNYWNLLYIYSLLIKNTEELIKGQ